jgi:3-deoxy-D-manno-octulosonate 8-phosphate phosphatase KdsC-like HAD superfamily phosphatase
MPTPKSISLATRLRRVKLFLTDVDGVMTDGTVIMGQRLAG